MISDVQNGVGEAALPVSPGVRVPDVIETNLRCCNVQCGLLELWPCLQILADGQVRECHPINCRVFVDEVAGTVQNTILGNPWLYATVG